MEMNADKKEIKLQELPEKTRIFLIGMMGTGKTFWGNRIAAYYNIPAYDLDALIEEQEGKTISEIFATEGELYFRKKEAEILRKLKDKKQFVIATGGGSPCFHNNMEWMNETGTTIWVDEPVAVLSKRLLKEKSHRPLIQQLNEDTLEEFLFKKLEERKPFYSKATYHLEGATICDQSFIKIIENHA